jgi:hypothetical protein
MLTLGRPRQEDRGSRGLHSKCKASLGYKETLSQNNSNSSKKKKKKKKKKNQTPKQKKIKHLGASEMA